MRATPGPQAMERRCIAALHAPSIEASSTASDAPLAVKARGSLALDLSLEPLLALLRGSGPLLAMAAARKRTPRATAKRAVTVDVVLDASRMAMRVAHDVHLAVAWGTVQVWRRCRRCINTPLLSVDSRKVLLPTEMTQASADAADVRSLTVHLNHTCVVDCKAARLQLAPGADDGPTAPRTAAAYRRMGLGVWAQGVAAQPPIVRRVDLELQALTVTLPWGTEVGRSIKFIEHWVKGVKQVR